MSKYRILTLPELKKPGKCANCGASKDDGRKYVDFGLEVDWYGIVYIDTLCLKDIAINTGIIQPYIDEIAKLKHELLSIKVDKEKGSELETRFLQTFEEVRAYLDHLHSSGDRSTTNSDVSMGTNETESDKPGVNQTEPRTTKSASGSRSENIRNLAKLLET